MNLLDVFGNSCEDRIGMIWSIPTNPRNDRIVLSISQPVVDGATETIPGVAHTIYHGLGWRTETRENTIIVVGAKPHVVDRGNMHFTVEILLLHTQIRPHGGCIGHYRLEVIVCVVAVEI